ncbi:epimerase [Agromyces luteolus]|uniref:SDR family oxidoreductase n=1 Tax=Agromyces luteolus TaxID=88373 RepID=A0A7C9HJ22_9MICO|nr:SDR family oxidoreductase [Agromyces luteolus]MUN08267.1 SDR family oxidoreductase [Agromyces luteolus]GLK26800.1 epimerase [Agromyces luteolus]
MSTRAGAHSATGPLAGTVVLVTGGSRGIGRATVETAHRDGAEVVVHYASNETAARALADALGSRVHLVAGDLLEPGEAGRVWDRAVEAAGRIDVLVNNAGAWLASPLDDDANWTRGWEQNLQLNLQAPADLCRSAIRHYQERGGGIIINLASRSSHRGDDAEHLAYGAAKGGLLALTKGIARGYAKDGVLAYAIAPGWVATDIAASDPANAGIAATLPLGEITPASDVAEMIAFLASGRSRHTTGATIDITGADYVR